MDQKVLIVFILLIPLMVIIGIAIGAFLSTWSVTNRMSNNLKGVITLATSLIVILFFAFLTMWSDIRISNPFNESDITITSS